MLCWSFWYHILPVSNKIWGVIGVDKVRNAINQQRQINSIEINRFECCIVKMRAFAVTNRISYHTMYFGIRPYKSEIVQVQQIFYSRLARSWYYSRLYCTKCEKCTIFCTKYAWDQTLLAHNKPYHWDLHIQLKCHSRTVEDDKLPDNLKSILFCSQVQHRCKIHQ